MSWKMKYAQIITVQGKGGFPIDMLRYDHLCPYTEVDSGNILRTFDHGIPEEAERRIRLFRYTEGKDWKPTLGRWQSFWWNILNQETQKLL